MSGTDDEGAPKDDDVFGLTGDCPLCLSPLPPMWEHDGHTGRMACCGKLICESCNDDKHSYMKKSMVGFHSKREEEKAQLGSVLWHCPFCRADAHPDQSKELLKRSKEGHGWADFCLYYFYRIHAPQVGKFRRVDLAMKHLKLSAERDYPIALKDLGDYYLMGDEEFGIEQSVLDARQLYQRAADMGHARARYKLADTYLSYDCLGYCSEEEEDMDKAIGLSEQAAEEGIVDSYFVLGGVHFPECGGKDDIDAALSYYRTGAELREEETLYRLGMICRQDEYLPNDTFARSDDKLMNLVNEDPSTAAMALFELGARQGCSSSQKELARCLIEKVTLGRSLKLFAAGANWMSVARHNSLPSEYAEEWCQRQTTKNMASQFCFNCYAHSAPDTGRIKLNCCSRCKAAWYCGRECQAEHWKKGGHKNICGGTKKFPVWTREDALEKTLDPFCVGIDPLPKEDQMSNYFSCMIDFYGTTER
mmetsp:Transcript_42343/g.88860  ORF Transcript_42343/g.88860 Transcript_42343/m.88860 type:complete len:477 (-) Transcript_42343:1292-2722(-)|eukprot:CAMPEP_0183708226 /NCGR_PEP_ID=MMETSP0737-20130205/4592_1 /TAXON_ID=385413 /ORGANISM="Thalassiosira miniscula, Strain CCMP1093" /LENGTH=476 /DNA_ID=CAMNT_0025936059 /DNA_START=236 /DNA_END=1666 /DNA_ORIENTATION=+